MATSEPLVPKGLPQGSRQQVRAGMRQAGMPLSPPLARPGANRTPPAAAPGPLNLLDAGPGAFPFLTDGRPAPTAEPVTANMSVHEALAASAQSDFARAVLARLSQRGD